MTAEREKRRVVALQSVEDGLYDKIQKFLGDYRRIPNMSVLGKAAIENYIDLARKYGIDSDWKVQVPDKGEK